uniref:RING-type domain-containing protein n=1 Tax=Caenorhabditis japonica TaxID=281687 RepID=A0A8R1HVI5_CAEJA
MEIFQVFVKNWSFCQFGAYIVFSIDLRLRLPFGPIFVRPVCPFVRPSAVRPPSVRFVRGSSDTESRKPCIGTCGHSICEGCKHRMASAKCPQCNRDEAFAITTINYQVLELIKHFKSLQLPGEGGLSRALVDSSKSLEEGICSECTLLSRNLRICVTCAKKDGVLDVDKETKKPVLIIGDEDVDDPLRKVKERAICGDCALDGQQHEGHKTIKLSVLKENVEDRALKTVKEKVKKLDEKARRTIEDLQMKFKNTIEALEDYFNQYETIEPAEQKAHLNNVEANIEQFNNTISMVEDCGKRLFMLQSEFKEHTKQVKDTRKVVSKSAIVFASVDPVLVADRKQSAKEPLLIGLFNPKQEIWQPVGRMPNPKSNYAVASNRSQIFIVGGMNNGVWLNSLEMYDKDKNLRRDCNRMRRGRTRTTAGFHNSKLYVAGGYDGGYLASVEIYDLENSDWREGPSLQKARADSAIVSCNGDLFVLGGFNGKEYEEKIEKLNDPAHKFETVGDMQGSRAGFGACAFKGRIYIAGGWSSSSNTLRSVRSYDPLTKKWRDEPSLNKDRKYFTLHATNEAVYAIRGCADSWSLINEVERLDENTGKWEIISCNSQSQQATTGPSSSPQGSSST